VFGAVASLLAEDASPSPFQRDLRALGFVVARAAGVLSAAVLTVNLLFGRPLIQSLMFAVALAVGLTPELLPMITTVTLSRGAVRMARRKVIVKRLASIHDLGAMTVLCTDKTGTLTSAEIVLAGSLDAKGQNDPRVAELAGVCAALAGDRGQWTPPCRQRRLVPPMAGPPKGGSVSAMSGGAAPCWPNAAMNACSSARAHPRRSLTSATAGEKVRPRPCWTKRRGRPSPPS
jgi:magnesium-transporting ATPase (P-type)